MPFIASRAVYEPNDDEGEGYTATNYCSYVFGAISTLFVVHHTSSKV